MNIIFPLQVFALWDGMFVANHGIVHTSIIKYICKHIQLEQLERLRGSNHCAYYLVHMYTY